jgi:hypothetical protein
MILPEFVFPSKINMQADFSGIDNADQALDKNHFANYPYDVKYTYNSRGLRDREWPKTQTELKEAIWCMGDSFTVGIGMPYEHTWPYILADKLKTRTINVAIDGASNEWIADKATEVLNLISPDVMVIHWSYAHRRQEPKDPKYNDDHQRQIWYNKEAESADVEFTKLQLSRVEAAKGTTKVVHSFIPHFHRNDQLLYKILERHLPQANIIVPFQILDYARDYHHYGKLTSKVFVRKIIERISGINATPLDSDDK